MPPNRGISVIIPTYNEVETIKVLLDSLFGHNADNQLEVIVVDASDSNDNLSKAVGDYKLQYVKSKHTSRSIQLNEGARIAKYDLLYFIHADVIPPKDFKEKIYHSLDAGNAFGYFRYQFNSRKILLKINSFLSQFKGFYTGGGDQTFFILKTVFEEQGGFNENLQLCEDFDLFDKLKKEHQFEIINSRVIVSDRKYRKANYFKVNLVNLYVLMKFRSGQNTDELKRVYERLIN